MALSQEEKERVRRFIAKHHVSLKEEVEEDVADFRGRTLEQAGLDVDSVCRTAAEVLAARTDRDRVLDEKEPPHPSYRAIMKRLREKSRAATS